MKIKFVLLLLLGCTVFGAGVVTVLFLMSEEKMQRNNAFQRRYVPHPIEKIVEYDLVYDSYYLAGIEDSLIYFGNFHAPLNLMQFDISNEEIYKFQVTIDTMELPYRRVRIKVAPPYFYVGDGTVPILFKGNTQSWDATTLSHNEVYFSDYTISDSSKIGIVTMSSETQRKALGIVKARPGYKTAVQLNTEIPIQQKDGKFETDGMLVWNSKRRQFIYTYYYRNQFDIIDHGMIYEQTGKTIDTISNALVDVAYYESKDRFKLGANTVLVHKLSDSDGDYLFIQSDRLGKYENEEVLKRASIFDVYNLNDLTYTFSFYLYHQEGKKVNEFKVINNLLVALVDETLMIYQLKPEFF